MDGKSASDRREFQRAFIPFPGTSQPNRHNNKIKRLNLMNRPGLISRDKEEIIKYYFPH